MPVRSWFPTLIYEAQARVSTCRARHASLIEDCHKLRAHDERGRAWCKTNYRGGYTSYASHHQLHKTFSSFGDLQRWIDPHALAFSRRLQMSLGERALVMTDCWVNIMPKHTTHSLHLHPLSVLSGTYYLKTPRGCSGLRFEDPRLSRFMGAPPKTADCEPENRQHVLYPTCAGKLILFESWLRHEVASNPTEAERISVSFNYNWL